MKLLVVDDHPLFREGLRSVLDALGSDVKVTEARDFSEALTALQPGADFDLILLDLRIPGMDDISGIKQLRDRAPDVPVVVVSALEDRRVVAEAFQHGAIGYIPKTSNSEVMINALKLVLAGGKYLPPIMAGAYDTGLGTGSGDGAKGSDMPRLTRRQRDVLALIGHGKSNKEIADTLGLAEGTVKIHVTAILKALKASNRTQAAIAAANMGLVKPSAGA
ncbi:MAG TPA: response regulator transcription factor [Alphaproteobacteria bacterium]|jgi:DNA-binding NarL/FixJ family response regulator|nr:response regulator transcription factor [Alphaproteobacteria bacterium]